MQRLSVAGPVIYELADAAGLLSTANVWINSELLTFGDIIRFSCGSDGPSTCGYPNNGISATATTLRLCATLLQTRAPLP